MAARIEQRRNANLARAIVNCRCHVCAFFDSRDDEYGVMLPFMKEGPQVILGGILRENPFYAPPDEFLRALGGRGARPR